MRFGIRYDKTDSIYSNENMTFGEESYFDFKFMSHSNGMVSIVPKDYINKSDIEKINEVEDRINANTDFEYYRKIYNLP